jgi:predicted aspartyl protease
MIIGHVTPNLQATIRLHIEDSSGQTQAIDVTHDTGFSSFMNLPAARVANLGLTWIFQQDVQLADGSGVRADVHAAVVVWDGRPRKIDVHAGGVDQLIGMRMLAGHDVRMRVVDGGPV